MTEESRKKIEEKGNAIRLRLDHLAYSDSDIKLMIDLVVDGAEFGYNLREEELKEEGSKIPMTPVTPQYVPFQLCPKCNGNRMVLNYQSSSMHTVCDICKGEGIIPMAKVS